jgi:hypothetical protein
MAFSARSDGVTSRTGVLKELANLTGLYLGCPTLMDLFFQPVSDLKKLERLSLKDSSSISDEGLKHLHGLANLQELDLRQTRVTAAGKAALEKALPKCRILLTDKDLKRRDK